MSATEARLAELLARIPGNQLDLAELTRLVARAARVDAIGPQIAVLEGLMDDDDRFDAARLQTLRDKAGRLGDLEDRLAELLARLPGVDLDELNRLIRPSEIDKDCRVHIWPGIGSLARWKIIYLDI